MIQDVKSYRVTGRCPNRRNAKVAVVKAETPEEAVNKAVETMGQIVVTDVEEFDGEESDSEIG